MSLSRVEKYHCKVFVSLSLILYMLLGLVFTSRAVVDFPYPQNVTYAHGIRSNSANALALQAKFQTWVNNYYTGNRNLARIRFDQTQYTVSEGIAYGMLLMVYFSDHNISYQSHFDNLWNYYKHFSNNNGLMNWKVSSFSHVDQSGAATDADLDAAVGLIMAYHQFGDSHYLSDAKNLIRNIRYHEVDARNLLKPGDSWDDKKNPSYVSPAAMELFAQIDPEGAPTWKAAISANYQLLLNNSHESTGLVSDWANVNGTVNGKDRFYYDASRAPWRLAWSYAWYGHSQARTINRKVALWITQSTGDSPPRIRAGYNRSSGLPLATYGNASFTGPLACAATVSPSQQAFVDKAWTVLLRYHYTPSDPGNSEYFNASMQLLTGLLLSGNMPDLSRGSPPTPLKDKK